MPWPTKVYSDKHDGDVFVMTNQRCGYNDCDHLLWQSAKNLDHAKETQSKYMTSVDREAAQILELSNGFDKQQIHSTGAPNDTELLCMHCGFHSLSNGYIDIRMMENDYSKAGL